jgi:hypothetical protein
LRRTAFWFRPCCCLKRSEKNRTWVKRCFIKSAIKPKLSQVYILFQTKKSDFPIQFLFNIDKNIFKICFNIKI